MNDQRPLKSGVVVAALGLAIALAIVATNLTQGTAPSASQLGSVSAPAAYKMAEPANRGLDANLYMQTSAEYRACCYQAYNLAMLRLEGRTRNKTGKLAVVMDLDETVFDNAGFQAMLMRSNLSRDQRLWDDWEKNYPQLVGLIPGAKEFIHQAKGLGVTVIYISNRQERFRTETKAALDRLGIGIQSDVQLMLAKDEDKGTDKTPRRGDAERQYTVLLYVGDNLRDFDEKFICPKF